jgi:hypothetical protein
MNCLDIVKFKDYCNPNYTGSYVSNFVDVSNIMLAHLASDAEQTGAAYSNQLLEAAKEQVWSDILRSASDGYSINSIVYNYVNHCKFTEVYSNWGSNLTNYFRSTNSQITVTTVTFKPELDGDFNLVLDDGKEKKIYPVTGISKTETTVEVSYTSSAKSVRIYCEDASKKFAMLTCQNGGCGSCAAKRGIHLQLNGYNRSGATTQATGFIPAAYISCNMESVICSVVNKYQSLFAKALGYQIGIMAYMRLLISPRMNDTTLNINEENAKLYLNTLEAKYKELMFGSVPAYGNAATVGIIKIMQQSFRTMNDSCVICGSQINTATAVF